MRWARTSDATLVADFITEEPVTDVVAEIVGPSAQVVDPGDAVEVDENTFNVVWTIPSNAEMGLWTITWTALAGSEEVEASETFEVVPHGFVQTSPDVVHLRNLTDRSMQGVPAFFSDDELHSLYLKNGGSIELAAYEAWLIKAATFAELTDQSEGGTERQMSQKFRNAMTMAKMFGDKAKATAAAALSSRRYSAKVISLNSDCQDIFGLSGMSGRDVQYVRTYPLHRFPVIWSA